MSDKVIVLCVVLAAVVIIAIVFIRRAVKYKNAHGAVVPETQPETPPKELSPYQIFGGRFLFRERNSFRGGKAVQIRPEYYAHIAAIREIVNRNGVSITQYLDGVLKAHFEDNAEVIEYLLRCSSGKPHDEKM